jgi:poly(3-hydroxybutyrate) depolymerase
VLFRVALALAAALIAAPCAAAHPSVRLWWMHYRTSHGEIRSAIVALPRWYGPHDDPPIPLVISPHGSGVEPRANVARWGDLPAVGRFAVVSPEGQGSRLELYSWGSRAQIADLAHMPRLVRAALPWFRLARHRVYAVGGSMGGQETLLLAADHPRLLAGAVSFDAPTNMVGRYRTLPHLLQRLARREIGTTKRAWADRSPIDYARRLADSGVPLEIWWSTRDDVVVDQADQSGRLYREIRRLNPHAPVVQIVGHWRHTAEMRWDRALPAALRGLGLLRGRERQHVLERGVLQTVGLGDGLVRDLPVEHVHAARERGIAEHGADEPVVGDLLDIRQRRVRERLRRGDRNAAGHVGDAVVDDAVDHVHRIAVRRRS